jgi:hypothetical protein
MAGYRWLKNTISKSYRSFTLPTGIRIELRISSCDSFGVAARVASPAVQGIVVTRDMALAF